MPGLPAFIYLVDILANTPMWSHSVRDERLRMRAALLVVFLINLGEMLGYLVFEGFC